jgi:hypothetical protein
MRVLPQRLVYAAVAALSPVLVLGVLGAPTADASTTAPIPGLTPGCSWQVNALPAPANWTYVNVSKGDGDSTYVGSGIDTTGATAVTRPLLWHAGQVQVLGTPTPGNGTALDVNRSGVVVADYNPMTAAGTLGPSAPYLWRNGSITPLAVPTGAANAYAAAINDAGQIVGQASIGGTFHAILWSVKNPTAYTDLGTAGDVNAFMSDISNLGVIVGRSQDGGFGQHKKAIAGRANPTVPLQALPGLETSAPSAAIASEGTYVVGTGRPTGDTSVAPEGLYADVATSVTPLPLIGGGQPYGVNTHGLMVGNGSRTLWGAATAWTATQRFDLPGLYAGSTAVSVAKDVMEDGTVVGYNYPTQNGALPVTWTCR